MKKIFKNPIFTFILGAIIFSGITVYAVNISSANVDYDNSQSGIEATTVEGAIDELYKGVESKMALNTFGDAIYEQTLTSYIKGDTITSINLNKGRYIIFSLKSYADVEGKKSTDYSDDYDYSNELQCVSNDCTIQALSSKFYKRSADAMSSNRYFLDANWVTTYYVQINSDNDTINFIGNWPKNYPIVPITYVLHAIPINE